MFFSVLTSDISYSYTITELTSNLTVTYNFLKNPCQQGEDDRVTLNIKNPNDNQIKLTFVGIHFDWQPKTDIYYVDPDVKNNNPILATN